MWTCADGISARQNDLSCFLRKHWIAIAISVIIHCVLILFLIKFTVNSLTEAKSDFIVEVKDVKIVEDAKPIEMPREEIASDGPTSLLSDVPPPSMTKGVGDSGSQNVGEQAAASLQSALSNLKESKSELKLGLSGISFGPGGGGNGNGAGEPPSGSGVAPLDAKAEASVNKALEWLASVQNDDGSWGVREETKHIYTSLAVLAFTCHGENTATKNYGENLIAAARALAQWSKSMGSVRRRPLVEGDDAKKQPADPAKNYVSPGNFHSHPLMLCAIARLYAGVKVPVLHNALEKASLSVAGDVERGLGGDWYDRWLHYQGTMAASKIPDSEKPEPACGELSFSGWSCVALRTSLWTGYEFEGVPSSLASTEKGIKLRFEDKGGGFRLSRGDKPDLSSTGLGIMSLHLLGAGNAKESNQSFAWMKRNSNSLKICSWKPDRQLLNENPDAFTEAVSGWFYQTQALFLATDGKGSLWRNWREASAKSLSTEQNPEGSWLTPAEKYGDESTVDVRKNSLAECSRTRAFSDVQDLKIYATTLCCLILETPYMQQPVFKPNQPKPVKVQVQKPELKSKDISLSLD